jgi:RNA 2',3'-cyclic 3'-phosphodiesterase
MARLFTAVELAPDTRAAIASCQSDVARSLRAAGEDGLRIVLPGHLHLTLVFIGDVPDDRASAITAAMTADIALPPFDIGFAACGVFPPRGPARVLWLGVDRGARELVELFEAVSARLEALGVAREHRPFAPHVTLGRWSPARGPRAGIHLPDVGRVAVDRVSSVTLFQSRLVPGGPEHTPLARAPLAAARTSLH